MTLVTPFFRSPASPGPLCGSLPATDAHVVQPGDMVAAHVVKPDDDRWILAVTLKCDRDRYTVEDLIEDDDKKEFVDNAWCG